MRLLISLIAGLLFGVGLALSGMMNPAKVQNFLDFAGDWDPSLALVMVAALAVTVPAFHLIGKRERPLVASAFHIPNRTEIDGPLLGGAALFGIGWGLVGFCPGPALAALSTGAWQPILFVVAMAVGMLAAPPLTVRRSSG